jgi:hypothetical protein
MSSLSHQFFRSANHGRNEAVLAAAASNGNGHFGVCNVGAIPGQEEMHTVYGGQSNVRGVEKLVDGGLLTPLLVQALAGCFHGLR